MKLSREEIEKRIVGPVQEFSPKLSEILLFLLHDVAETKKQMAEDKEALKQMVSAKNDELQNEMDGELKRLKDVIRNENSERTRDLRDLQAFVMKENSERKKETDSIKDTLRQENEQRIREANDLKAKIEKEKQEMQAYLEKDAKEMQMKIDQENKALQQKLDREAEELKKRLSSSEEQRRKEAQALKESLEKDKDQLAKQFLSDNKQLSEKMAQEEAQRRKEAQEMKERLEADKKQQGNAFTEMFDRLKAENDQRKMEVHGLKDILVRENGNRQRDTEELRMAMELSSQKLVEAIEREAVANDKKLKLLDEDLNQTIQKEKKDVITKIDALGSDLKKRLELETNDLRDRMQIDKKTLMGKLEEETEDRRKEMGLMRGNMGKERDELRGQMEADSKMLLEQLEKDSRDIINLIKKEKCERERDTNVLKERIDNEKKELQLSIDKDRQDLTKRMNEEHDQRRLEQKELVQRLDDNEKTGKSDITELYGKVRREQEARENEVDDMKQSMKNDRHQLEEKILKEKQAIRDCLLTETGDLMQRLDKLCTERANDVADLQTKMALIGKSASKHLDNLRQSLYRDCQNLFELCTKPCSVVFNAFRDDSYTDGGEDYLTFTGCTVNIGNAMNYKSGEFKVQEPGLYLFLFTCCTLDMKKCLLSIRKNGKDVANCFDQDGDTNKGRSMIGQNLLLELVEGDKVQIYVNTGSGISDHKNSHYTQFIGIMLRPSVDTLAASMRKLGNVDQEDDNNNQDDFSVRSQRGINGAADISRRNQRASSRNRLLSPQPPSVPSPSSGTSAHLQKAQSPQPQTQQNKARSPTPQDQLLDSQLSPTVVPNSSSSVTKLDEQVMLSPIIDPLLETIEEEKSAGGTPAAAATQQSYLALTKLGMGKKPVDQPQKTNKSKKSIITEFATPHFLRSGANQKSSE